jgi:hypothetical protein
VNPPLRYLRGGGIVTAGCFSGAGDFGPPLNGTRPGYGRGAAKEGPSGANTPRSPSEETLTPARGVAPRGREPAADPP